ncbi:glycoside hydrolase family 88 protein, partial [Paenibacillus sepulcri]|nr:glycoside hydrolase family 88 protein [Paenibacillus sepulcri]
MRQYGDLIWKQMKKDHSGEWGMDIQQWDWVPGVGVIALMEYYEAVQDPEILAYLVNWVANNKDKAEGTRAINSIAPYAVFPVLHRLTGDDWYAEEAERVARWLICEAPRTREQAFEH